MSKAKKTAVGGPIQLDAEGLPESFVAPRISTGKPNPAVRSFATRQMKKGGVTTAKQDKTSKKSGW